MTTFPQDFLHLKNISADRGELGVHCRCVCAGRYLIYSIMIKSKSQYIGVAIKMMKFDEIIRPYTKMCNFD